MFRNLYADTRKIFFSRGFYLGVIVILLYQIFASLIIWMLTVLFIKGQVASDEIAFSFTNIAVFVVTATTLLVMQGDFEDGCIRNKLISGVKRRDAFLSVVISGMLLGALLSFIAFVSSMAVLPIFSEGFMNYKVSEIADYWLIITLSCMAIGGFSASLIMVLGGSKLSYVVGLAIAFGLETLDTHVLDKLYPEKGNCTLTGSKLLLYKFIDRYIPYSYLSIGPHWDSASYLAGCTGLILISVIIGLLVVERKEIH